MASIGSPSRDECIEKLKVIMDGSLRGEEDLIVASYDYLPSNPEGISPYFATVAAGSHPAGGTSKRRRMDYYANLYWFVLFSSKTANIDEGAAWKALNDISRIAFETLLANNRVDSYWMGLDFEQPSQVDVMRFDNHGYLVEGVQAILHVF